MRRRQDPRRPTAAFRVTAALVPLHIAAHAERLAAPGVRALVRLLAGVGVGVDLEAGGAGEGLVAGGADVAVLGLREDGLRARADVVVVLPDVAGRRGVGGTAGVVLGLLLRRRREVGRQLPLVVEA